MRMNIGVNEEQALLRDKPALRVRRPLDGRLRIPKMNRATLPLLVVATGLMLSACVPDPRFYQPYYQPPMPPPLQPYVEPAVLPPAVVHRRVVRHHHYHRKHYRQPRCPCTQPMR
jgi:hypothetical protein